MIETLPFECQIEVLQHLPANSIEIVKTILPSWSQSCSDVSLWRRILDESLKTSPILDSNYADKLDKVNRNDQSALENCKTVLEKSQENFKLDLQRWKANEEALSRNMLYRSFAILTKVLTKPVNIVFWGSGLEYGTPDGYSKDLLWSRPDILKVERMEQNGGIVLKYNKGRKQQEFVLKMLYSSTHRERTTEENVVNRRGVYNPITQEFVPSNLTISRISDANHFLMILNSTKLNFELVEAKAELLAFVKHNVTSRLRNIARFRTTDVLGANTSIKLGVVLMATDAKEARIFKPFDVVKSFELVELEKMMIQWGQESQSDRDILTGGYSTVHSSRMNLHWRICEANYNDFDSLDIMFQWLLM